MSKDLTMRDVTDYLGSMSHEDKLREINRFVLSKNGVEMSGGHRDTQGTFWERLAMAGAASNGRRDVGKGGAVQAGE
jgi:hypothetical protein